MIKTPGTRGGYSPARGLENTNPQWAVEPVEKKAVNVNRNGVAILRVMPLFLFRNLASSKWSTVLLNIVLEKMQLHVGDCKIGTPGKLR